jgi:hypothetical protein
MGANRTGSVLNLVSLLCLLLLPVPIRAQTAAEKKLQAKAGEKETSPVTEAASTEAQRRVFAISLVISLATEARSYHDEALRPHVLARAADTLWAADGDTARSLFRRAWEAAVIGDAKELTLKNQDGVPPKEAAMVTALRRISGFDLRADVLGLAARRDRALGEEFLNKLKEETDRAALDAKNDSNQRDTNDSWSTSEAVSKRLQVANKLLDQGEIDRAMEFAAPVLDRVSANSISFLSALRGKRPEAAEVADQRFAALLTRAEFDPSSDANTASGLSSYVFTPGLYVTFSPDGNARWSQPEETIASLKPPNLPATLRNRFLQVAGSILLRPLPSADQDFTSSGRSGKYMVIKRLLPLFDQYAPDTAAALRSQLTALAGDGGRKAEGNDSPLLTQGLQQEETADSAFENLQYRLDHAKTTQERDSLYAGAAAVLGHKGDARARDLADKIDNANRRAQVGQYVDFELVRFAVRKKEASEVARLARVGQLTHTQRVWAYTQAARLLMNTERPRAIQFLEEAATEALRINADDPDRARSFVAVATQFVTVDRIRSWEIMGEAIKAANSAEGFTGEAVQLRAGIASKSGLKISSVDGEDFGLSGILNSLAKADLYRSIDLAKSFKNDAPRAAAILAIAKAVLVN